MAASPPTLEPRSAAIGYRRPGSARLFPLLLVSIGLHILLALGLAFVLSRHLKEPSEVVDLGIDVTLGETVQELIVAQPSTEPPAPTPPPPPPEPPPPEPPPEPPPVPMEKAEFVEPKPEPKPPPKPAPKRDQPKATPAKPGGAPPGAKVGPVPQEGVVGGVSKADKTTGTPGGQTIGTWRTPKPPYPNAALISHIQGSGEVRIATDAAGNMKEVTVTRPISPLLDANTRSFARANWKGPPNSTRTVPVIYRIP